MIGRRNVKNRTFDWQTENLPAVDLNNAQEEGFELVRSPAVPTVRQTNLTQISKRDATVSASQEASDAAGKNSEMAHQMAIKSKALKSDVESIAFSRQAKSLDDATDRHPQDREHSAPDRARARRGRRAGHARLRHDDRLADGVGHGLGRSGRCAVHRGHARRCHGQGLRRRRRADPADRALQHQAQLGALQRSREHSGARRENGSGGYRGCHCH